MKRVKPGGMYLNEFEVVTALAAFDIVLKNMPPGHFESRSSEGLRVRLKMKDRINKRKYGRVSLP